MPALSFNIVPIKDGFKLTDERGVTKGFITIVTKDMLSRFYVSGPAGPTFELGYQGVKQ